MAGENPASRLAVSPKVLTLKQNQAVDLMAVGFTSAGDTADVAVTWSVTSGLITDTSTNNGRHYGRYRAGSDTGKVKVIARGNPGGIADTAVVTVTLTPVTSVTVSPASASAQVGQTILLSATTKDSAGNVLSGRTVTWATSSSSVATVSSSGLVTAASAGSATITATSEGQRGTAAITVTTVPVASVTVTPASATVTVGQTVQLAATPKDANGNPLTGRTVTWATSTAAVATVSGSGLVTGGAAGTATITASSEGKNGAAAITVTAVPVPVASVAVTPASVSLTVGQTAQLAATPKDANGNSLTGRTVTWATSNATVATVSGSGLVTAGAAGTATITASSEGKSGAAALTVAMAGAELAVVSLAASGDDGNIPSNTRDNNLATRWSAYGDGQWIGYDLGRVATISYLDIAWYRGNEWASAFEIEVSPDAISWTKAFDGRSSGQTLQPERYDFPTVTGRYVRIVGHGQWSGTTQLDLWNSVTEVDIYGAVVGPVVPLPVASVAVSPASASVLLGGTQQLSAVLKDANGYVLTGRTVTWTSNSAAVALVSASGLVTGVAAGTASITATSEGKSGTAAITVTSAGSGPNPGPTALIIFQDGFESGDLSQWGFQSDAGSGRYSVTTNAARVKSGTRSLETLYTPTNAYGMITRWFMPGYDEVYVKFSVMFEEGFQNKRPDGAGMHYFVLAGNNINDSHSSWGKPAIVPNGADYFYAGLDPEEISLPTLQPFSYYTYWPDMSCCYGNMFYQQSPKVPLLGGQWQEVVFHIKLNTPGQYDGSQTVWINGVKKLDMQNMRWRTTTDLRLNEIRFDNYMGSGSPITEHVWLDDVVVWTP